MRFSSMAWGGMAVAVIVVSWATTRAALMRHSHVSPGIDHVGPSAGISPVRRRSLTNASAIERPGGGNDVFPDSQRRITFSNSTQQHK